MSEIRHDWTREEIRVLFDRPLLDLVFEAASVHRQHHNANEVQWSTLVSVKTGGCPEDCGYCSQSAHYDTPVDRTPLMNVEEVLEAARIAKANGSTRLCMGAAWRQPRPGKDWEQVLDMVRQVNAMGMESCVTLGMLTEEQAQQLAEAGLTNYNHNIDTSPEFYEKIISTRKFSDRIQTIENVQKAGIGVCSGGIMGLGESTEDRVGFIHTLATLAKHPDSVPINALVAVEGTPLSNRPPVESFEFIRMIAVARITMPGSMVRLSAGRLTLTEEAQAMCFLAGANSIFTGETLLTTENPGFDQDQSLLKKLGLKSQPLHAVELDLCKA
ncbi:MAG: biotin synthase BioB [Bacteroidetes bacterium]|nr:biotin synthase BioB [Bacteroidota bacterium]